MAVTSMWKRQVAVALLAAALLGGCSEPKPGALHAVPDETAECVSAFVTSYKQDMVAAVNDHELAQLEADYLLPNTSFFHALQRYGEELQKNGSTKELVSFEVENVYEDDKEGDYFADVIEQVHIMTDDQVDDITRNVRYWVVEGADQSLRLYTIIDRTNESD
ncbi:hypothetical protein MKZ19_12965 [Shouchella clausii]|uniref:TcaA NTF2-like domain-containing protein n=1 Tax=Shouchella clausii TaxID=79880 RepID=UPI0031FD2DD2